MHAEHGRYLMTQFLCTEYQDLLRQGIHIFRLGGIETRAVDQYGHVPFSGGHGAAYVGEETVTHLVYGDIGKSLGYHLRNSIEELLLRRAPLPEQHLPPALLRQ